MDFQWEKLKIYNREFDEERLKEDLSSFQYKIGKYPILLSAPHSVSQWRNKKRKAKEGYTGAFVKYLAEKKGCFSIYKTNNAQDDANYDIEHNLYKEKIIELVETYKIKVLIDFHGAKDTYGFDIELGTDNGRNLNGNKYIVDLIKESFTLYDIIKIQENNPFKADSMHTISKTIATKLKIPCIQIEIASKYRQEKNEEEIRKMIQAFEIFLDRLKEVLEKENNL